jgi:hypothetical protein
MILKIKFLKFIASVYVAFIGALFFFVSLSFLGAYSLGDQVHYHNFYNLIRGVPFSQVAPIALSTIDSAEPLSWLVLWVGSNLGFDKDLWIAFLNTFLIVGLVIILKKNSAPWYLVPLLLTNFYVIVLMTSAERLKIGYIFLIWAFIFEGRWRVFFNILSPLAHLQSLIFIISLFMSSISKQVRYFFVFGKFRKKEFLYIFILIFLVALIFIYLQDGILRKVQVYASESISVNELVNIFLLVIIGLLVTKDRLRLFLALLPLIAAVAIIGGQRVNMIAVSVFIGLMMYERRLSHPLVVLLLFYFSMKSIPFVLNIYQYGNGFGGPLW